MMQIEEKDRKLLPELRQRISDILEDEDEYRNSDGFLVSWLRHKNHNLSHMEKAFRHHTKWRREHNIDFIHLEIIEELPKFFPYEIHGVDKVGRPVVWVPFGKWDLEALSQVYKDEDFARYTYQFCQNIELAIMQEYSKRIKLDGEIVHQFTGIFDLADFSYRQLLSPRAVRLMTNLASAAEANWPLRCGSMIALNAPGIVKFLLNIIKPFLSKNTKSGIRIYNSNRKEWEEALQELIEINHIPINFGGDRDSAII